MKLSKIVILLVLFCHTVVAQLSQPARYEKELKPSDSDFIIISLEHEGIALFRETEKFKEGKHHWQLIVLDTALQQKMDTILLIDKDYAFVGHEYLSGRINLIFKEGEYAKNKLTLCSIDLAKTEIKSVDIRTELDLRLTHFSSIRNNVLFGGYISDEPAVLYFDVAENKVRMVPGFLQSNTELLDLRVNENNTFNVVLLEKIATEAKRIIFRTFDSQAKILLEDIIETEGARQIQTAISSTLHREDLLIMGTWNTRNSAKSYGFYTTLINPFEEQGLNFKAFGSLEHYLDFLKPRRAEKIKNKTKEALASDKIYDFTNNVIPYRIIENDLGYFVLAETYSALSSPNTNYYNNQTSQNWNNPYYYNNPFYNTYPTSRMYRPMTYSENVNNESEIKTYSSSLLFVNKRGEIENDYSIKIENRKLPSITQVTDAMYADGEAFLLYREKEKITYKKIDVQSETEETGNESVKLKDDFDELRHEGDNSFGIRHWHNNFFYTWGQQTIRNQQLTENKTREVFYINKIRME